MAIVGSGPGSLANPRGLVDSHDLIVRVNNYKLAEGTGLRTDVHYSFYGRSIKKSAFELKRDGVGLCLCKCPDAQPIVSDWHIRHGQHYGTDFRWIYQQRKDWWFCDTYIPTVDEFLVGYELLGKHVPTTGFAAILDILSFEPRAVFLTGFDFFRSYQHNVDEAWQRKDSGDPIGHVPEQELAWLAEHWTDYPLSGDDAVIEALTHAGEPMPPPPPGMRKRRRNRRLRLQAALRRQ